MLTQEEQVDIIAMHRHKIPIKEKLKIGAGIGMPSA